MNTISVDGKAIRLSYNADGTWTPETVGTDNGPRWLSVRLPANGAVQITLRDALKGDAADKKLYGKASAAGNVYITACYHSEV